MAAKRAPGGGRKPLPTEKKIVQGTFNKYRHKDNTAAFETIESLVPPVYLSKEGQRQYMKTGKKLQKIGVLKDTDLQFFSHYAAIEGLLVECLEGMEAWEISIDESAAAQGVKRPGRYMTRMKNGQVAINPFIKEYNRLLNLQVRIAPEFGLTPSSRTRIEVPKMEEVSIFAKFG